MYIFLKKNMGKIYSIVFFPAFVFLPFSLHAATLSIVPSTGSFETGQSVAVKIIATSNNTPLNAVSGVLEFPRSIFSIESISKKNSVLNFWVTEPVINSNTVKFEGIALGGFAGGTGTILTVNLRAIKSGGGQISFKSGQILANDGEGTDVTGNLIGGSFSVSDAVAKVIQPKSEINQKKEIAVVPEVIELSDEILPQPAPTLKAPEIALGAKYGAQAILGTSLYPKAQALLTFTAEDGVKVFILGDADTDGSFNLLVPNTLKSGRYSISAVMIKEDKTNSTVSNTITIHVGNIFADINYKVYIVFGILVLLILYFAIRSSFYSGKRVNKNNKNEIKDIEDVVHKSFDILRDDISEYNKGEDTGHKRVSEIKKDINEAEKIIDKEIKNIE